MFDSLAEVAEKYTFYTVINKPQTQAKSSAAIYFRWLQDLDDTKRQSNTTTDFSWVSQTLLTLIDFATKDVDLTVFRTLDMTWIRHLMIFHWKCNTTPFIMT